MPPSFFRTSPRKSFAALCLGFTLHLAGCSTQFPTPSPDNDGQPIDSGNTPNNDDTPIPTPPIIPPASADPEPLDIEIKAAPVFCCSPLAIDFEATVAGGTTGFFTAFEWDYGDARVGSGRKTTHSYSRPGLYFIKLVALHADGSEFIATKDLPVGVLEPDPSDPEEPPDNEIPPDDETDPDAAVLADAGPDQTVNGGDEVTLDGAANATSELELVDIAWRQVGGPVVTITSSNSAQPSFTAPTGFEYATVLTFELTAFIEGASARDQVDVTVLPSVTEEPPVDDPSQDQLVAWMAELPPLPKVHYSFPLHPTLLGEPISPLLYQYVRITRAVSLSSAAKDWQVSAAVNVCNQINNLGDGGLPATIAINHSPWHNSFPADLPPTYNGPESAAEIDAFRLQLTSIKGTLASFNASRGTQIPVSAVLFDTERFYVKPSGEAGAAEWNAAINAKYAPFYDLAKQHFPQARVEWYGHGIQESQGETGWSPFPWFTFDEPADTLACSLYRVSELETMRETFRQTHAFALDLGFSEVTPWIALGAGYRRDAELFQVWQQDWDYDPVYSLLLGREINQWWHATLPDRFAPWDAARVVVFYPAPFDPRTPAWGKHFIAYVRGAAGRNDLP